MKVVRDISKIIAYGENGEELRLTYDNRGEPYREGASVSLTIDKGEYHSELCSVFLEHRELVEFRNAVNKLLGE